MATKSSREGKYRIRTPKPPPRLPNKRRCNAFASGIEGWFEENGRSFPWRKKSVGRYGKIVSEVLLQRTRAETVGDFFPQFTKRFPSWKALSQSSKAEIGKALVPIGIWRRRAEVLLNLAREVRSRGGRFPGTREELETMTGVGQYVASSILLFVYGQPEPLLDATMARVLERYFGPRTLVDIRYDPYLQGLARKVLTCGEPANLNWAILDLGAALCKINEPQCDKCPLARGCKHALKSP